MAKQLYDYWFVQFDFPNEEGKPYKSSGGAMVYNERLKREIPVGWQVENLVDFAEIKNGATPSTSDDTNYGGDIVWITPKDLSDQQSKFVYQGERNITKQGFDSCSTSMLPINSVLMSSRAPIGLISIAKHEVCTNQGFKSFIPKNMEDSIYLYYYIKHHIKQIEQLGTGTTFKEVSRDDLCKFPILVVGANETYKQWVELQDEIANKQFVLTKEIASLTKQRDELLPLLMNGQASVNYHLCVFQSFRILYGKPKRRIEMKENIVKDIVNCMRELLTQEQLECLGVVVRKALSACEVVEVSGAELQQGKDNAALLDVFISAKKIEGCSEKTLQYYKSSIEKLVMAVGKNVCETNTNDIRCYLAELQEKRGLSKVTMDNLRRIYSSFFSWLEDEDYITKSPVRRIHKVRTDALVKEVLSDENIEVLRDSCHEFRDIAMIDLLFSTGMRVGELVRINREDIDLHERQCVVFGKGNKEREVYFNARAKIHLKKYLEQRTDDNPALFVSLKSPYNRLTINGVEVRLRKLGAQANIATKVHPHKFRRTLATMAIDKGMPIEQVQKMLGHVKIDTTMHYAMVNQANVKIAHRKFIN